MRLLVISAFYPPHEIGGWEQNAREINDYLHARGHAVRTLTSTHGVSPGTPPLPDIDRILELEADQVRYDPIGSFLGRKRRWRENLHRVTNAVVGFRPDVVLVYLMWNLSAAIPWQAEQLLPGRVVYFLADYWPHGPSVHSTYWTAPTRRRIFRLPKRVLGSLALRRLSMEDRSRPLRFDHVLCVSEFVKRDLLRNVPIAAGRVAVIRNGIDLETFSPGERFPFDEGDRQGLSLLYAGSLAPHKGVHTAVEAMEILRRRARLQRVTLTVVGKGHPDYERELRARVGRVGLEGEVRFAGSVPREEMPALLRRFDVLVFPSVWEEPLARAAQEAMASGVVVVGTVTGGMGELLVEGETGLTFQPGDAVGLARRIEELIADAALRRRLRENAREKVVREFDIRRMLAKIESYLADVARGADGSDEGGSARAALAPALPDPTLGPRRG